jgi:parallel beta-helix repeat protein
LIKVKHLTIFYGLLAIEAAQPCFAQGLRIDQLHPAGTPSDSDLIAIEPAGVPPAKKISLGALKGYVNAAPINPNAFYVATNGSDSNPGTLGSPFATLPKAQAAMRASATIKTTYIRAGTYNLTQVPGSTCFTDAVDLNAPSDSGTTWSYYPPDGVNTAILDGGSTSPSTGIDDAFCMHGGAANITINGLQFQRYKSAAIYMVNANNSVFKNNIVHDINMTVLVGLGGFYIRDATNVSVLNNYFLNTTDSGFAFHTSVSGGINGAVISNNFVYNTCTNSQDCGGIYTQDFELPPSTGITISNNYVRDSGVGRTGNGFTGAVGIYLDDGSSNHTITGNVITGAEDFCIQLHGGKNNTMSGNICDESSGGGKAIVYYQQTAVTGSFPMTGNVLQNNIVIAGSAGAAGQGYLGSNSPPAPMTVQHNAYHNYVGASVNSTGSGGAGSDASPVSVDPQLSCWAYNISATSPALSPPVSLPGVIIGGWGPPGFIVPQIGTVPSSPHGC